MIAIGIVISILGYAVIYAGVEELKTGASVRVLDTLKPGFTPPPIKGAGTADSPPSLLQDALLGPLGAKIVKKVESPNNPAKGALTGGTLLP